MFYLGEYDEDEADDIRAFLNNAGIRVELKPYLVMDSSETYCLHGRYSRLKELTEDMTDFEHYLSLIKRVFSQSSTQEEFDELFLTELNPEMMKKRDQIMAISESATEPSPEETSEETPDDIESLDFDSDKWLSFLRSSGEAIEFARSVFYLNGIEIGKPLEDKLDDPLLEIPVDPDEYEHEPGEPDESDVPGETGESDEQKITQEFFLSKSMGLYVDEFTTPLVSEIDEEFCELYPDEYQQLSAMGMLIEKLATPPSARKMSLDEFNDNCILRLDKDGFSLVIDGRDVSMALIRILEKSDVLKSKGDRIKWKK